ncbi:MAG: HRDC domain-containing protein [Actinomycetota bacterium]
MPSEPIVEPDAESDADADDIIVAPEPLPILELSAAVPTPLHSPAELPRLIEALMSATGPVAIDAERASGYRYGQRAYLVQLRRDGAGTWLLDPVGLPDMALLNAAIREHEWVLHAASQDLPCLAELQLRPTHLFDTELAARLAGYERVGLAAMVETVMGYNLEKGHSSADWSQRPLPDVMLRYAALDVEVLVSLRDHLEGVLREQGKWDWAQEEFAAIVAAPPAAPRVDPWRRTSGIHRLRTRRQLAHVRALWHLRDETARRRDIAPGRVLPDAAIVEAALKSPATVDELAALPVFSGRANRRKAAAWFGALQESAALADDALPSQTGPGDSPPPTHRWSERDPVAAHRLAAARAAVLEIAAEYELPVENLVEPAVVRRLAWSPPSPVDLASVEAMMTAAGSRRWQIELTAAALAEALAG